MRAYIGRIIILIIHEHFLGRYDKILNNFKNVASSNLSFIAIYTLMMSTSQQCYWLAKSRKGLTSFVRIGLS